MKKVNLKAEFMNKPIKESEWRWYGHPIHLCVSSKCVFHLGTEIGGFVVSTVGDYRPDGERLETIAAGDKDFYETMVFSFSRRCGCGCEMPLIDCPEIFTKRYETPGDANDGHFEICLMVAKGEIK